jgi:hypothetical protein
MQRTRPLTSASASHASAQIVQLASHVPHSSRHRASTPTSAISGRGWVLRMAWTLMVLRGGVRVAIRMIARRRRSPGSRTASRAPAARRPRPARHADRRIEQHGRSAGDRTERRDRHATTPGQQAGSFRAWIQFVGASPIARFVNPHPPGQEEDIPTNITLKTRSRTCVLRPAAAGAQAGRAAALEHDPLDQRRPYAGATRSRATSSRTPPGSSTGIVAVRASRSRRRGSLCDRGGHRQQTRRRWAARVSEPSLHRVRVPRRRVRACRAPTLSAQREREQ